LHSSHIVHTPYNCRGLQGQPQKIVCIAFIAHCAHSLLPTTAEASKRSRKKLVVESDDDSGSDEVRLCRVLLKRACKQIYLCFDLALMHACVYESGVCVCVRICLLLCVCLCGCMRV